MLSKVHQGDVFLEEVNNLPEGKKKILRKDVVAFGEVTGHSHKIKGCEVVEIGGREFLCLQETKTMTHDEHPPVDVKKGNYRIKIQKEYFPEGNRNVQD